MTVASAEAETVLSGLSKQREWPCLELLEMSGGRSSPPYESYAKLGFTIQNTLPCLEGHFPDVPVVPGIVQIHWATWLAKQLLFDNAIFYSLSQIKFQTMMLPEQSLILTLKRHNDQIKFCYHAPDSKNDGVIFSQGKLHFYQSS